MSNHARGREMLARRDKEMIPTGLLIAMVALALSALVLAGYARLTDRPLVGVPHDAEITNARAIILDGSRDGAVTVRDDEGAVLMDLGPSEAGFISVIWRGLDRRRMLTDSDRAAPVDLIAYANGRLSLQDPVSGWSTELASFGDMNQAAFARLLE